MVVAPHHLAPVTQHRPAALEMQLQTGQVETGRVQIPPDPLDHLPRDQPTGGMLMQLPHTVEIAGPGTAWIGVAAGLSSTLQHRLQESRKLQRVKIQMIGGDHGGEKGMQLQATPPTDPHHPPASHTTASTPQQ